MWCVLHLAQASNGVSYGTGLNPASGYRRSLLQTRMCHGRLFGGTLFLWRGLSAHEDPSSSVSCPFWFWCYSSSEAAACPVFRPSRAFSLFRVWSTCWSILRCTESENVLLQELVAHRFPRVVGLQPTE